MRIRGGDQQANGGAHGHMRGCWGRRGHLRVGRREEAGSLGGTPAVPRCLHFPSVGPSVTPEWVVGPAPPPGVQPRGKNPAGRAGSRSQPWAKSSTSPTAPCLSFPFKIKKPTVGTEGEAGPCRDSGFHAAARCPWGDLVPNLGVRSPRWAREVVAVGELRTGGLGHE